MAAREKVSIQLDVETAQAIGAWLQNNRAIVQNEESLRKLEDASKRAGKSSKEGFDLAATAVGGVMRQVTGLIAGMASVHTATALFRKELEAVDRIRQKALDFQLDVGTAQRQAITALGPNADISMAQFVEMIESGTKIPLATQYAVATAAVSGAGQLGARRGTETALAAGELAPHENAQALRAIASGAIELQKSFPEYGARESVAQILQAASVARQEDVGALAKNTIPAVGQARAFFKGNADFQTLFALLNAVGQRSGDVEGSRTRTAVTSFLKQITTEGATRGMFEVGASPDEMFAAIQGDTEEAKSLRRKLLGPLEASFRATQRADRAGKAVDPKLRSEAQQFIAMSELFDPNSQTFQMFRQFREQGAGTPQEVLARQEAFGRQIEALPGQQAVEVTRALQAGAERFRAIPSRALAGISSESMRDFLVESGSFASEEEFKSFLKKVDPDKGVESILDRVRRRRFEVEGGFAAPMPVGGAAMAPVTLKPREATAEQVAIIEGMKAVEMRLVELIDAQREARDRPQKVELPANAQPARPGAAALNEAP